MYVLWTFKNAKLFYFSAIQSKDSTYLSWVTTGQSSTKCIFYNIMKNNVFNTDYKALQNPGLPSEMKVELYLWKIQHCACNLTSISLKMISFCKFIKCVHTYNVCFQNVWLDRMSYSAIILEKKKSSTYLLLLCHRKHDMSYLFSLPYQVTTFWKSFH